MTTKPVVDTRDITNLWQLAVRVYEALESVDGHRRRANTFHCEFMREKSGNGLLEVITRYVEVIE